VPSTINSAPALRDGQRQASGTSANTDARQQGSHLLLMAPTAARSVSRIVGLHGVSAHSTRVFCRNASRYCSGRVASTKETAMPQRAAYVDRNSCVPPVTEQQSEESLVCLSLYARLKCISHVHAKSESRAHESKPGCKTLTVDSSRSDHVIAAATSVV
jgi:hypothetical protein